MIELKGRYTPAQARAIKKFLANKAEIKIRMSKPYKDIVKQKASEAGMSVNGLRAMGALQRVKVPNTPR